MRSTNLARVLESTVKDCLAEVRASVAPATVIPQAQAVVAERVPALRVMPLLPDTKTRQFVRVPTHAVGVHPEHREYPRATLRLPLRLRSVNEIQERFPITLVTRDISSSGVFFLCPKELAAGTKIEIEIVLVSRPMGRGNVVVATAARVKRLEPAATPGWFGVAALFEDVVFDRDDRVPTRFMK
jgi:PilZ domain